ncbi:MAG: DUF2459 domain-containing protein [Balneolaceae bacterium]
MMSKWLLFLMIFCTGCLGPVTDVYPEDEQLRPIPIYVVSHGWHVGIAIESSYINHKLPEHEQMPTADFLMFGWGDDKYYVNPDAGFWLLMRAAFLPTRSVIHVVGFNVPVEDYFTGSRIVKVQISKEGADKFAEYIEDRFRRENDSIQFAADGLYNNSVFFKATGLYFFPKTSNTWTARALRQTGYPITPFYAITSGNVMHQAGKEGEVVRE